MKDDGSPNNTAKEILQRMAVENNADVLVTGSHGRKGEKEDPTVMGTAVQYLSVYATKPVLIMKRPKKRSDRIEYNMK